MMNKKRRHKRVPISAAVSIRPGSREDDQPIHAMAANISLSGIGLYSDSPLEPETEVSLNIHFISTGGIMKTVSLQGSVVFIKEIGDMYFMGIEFDEELNQEGQPSLHEHLMSILTAD
jgi:c-di-GMP-binding flagellar brake protein YcgR